MSQPSTPDPTEPDAVPTDEGYRDTAEERAYERSLPPQPAQPSPTEDPDAAEKATPAEEEIGGG